MEENNFSSPCVGYCIDCVFWKKMGRRVNPANEIVVIGMCKNRNSLNYNSKTEERQTCEEFRKREGGD